MPDLMVDEAVIHAYAREGVAQQAEVFFQHMLRNIKLAAGPAW